MVPSRRKSRPSGTSSAVSSRPSIVRAIAPVRALTTREAVDWDTPGRRWESGRRVVVDWLPRFALPSREGPRIEAGEAILARVSGGPRRAAGREPAGIATTSRDEPGPACVMRAQRNGIHPTSRHASSVRRNPPQLDPRHPTSHNASPADTTKTDAPGDGAHRTGITSLPGAGLTARSPAGAGSEPATPRGRGSPTDGAPDPGPHPDSPGADAQTNGATGATGPGLAPAPRPRRPPLVGDGADKPSFGAFPRISARFYRGCHQLMDRTGRRFP